LEGIVADDHNQARFFFMLLVFPSLVAIVFLIRRFVLEPVGLVPVRIGLAEVIVWSFAVSAVVAAAVSRVLRTQAFGPMTFGLVATIGLLDVLRSKVLAPAHLVGSEVTLFEVLAWSLVLGAIAATALAPGTQAFIGRTLSTISLPAGSRVVAYAVVWAVAVLGLSAIGVVWQHPYALMLVVGLVNGSVLSVTLLPFARRPFYKGLTTFIGGVTADNFRAEHTAVGQLISGVAQRIDRIATFIASQFGAGVGNLQDPLRLTLWTTVFISVLVLLVASSTTSARESLEVPPAGAPGV
jgi:hypothetical protein